MKQRKPMYYWGGPILSLAKRYPESDANGANGYIRVSRDNIVDYLHRLIWVELNGPIPVGMTIDHKDGIKTNNEPDNLRLVPEVINRRNVGKRNDNTSGVTGVSYWSAGHAWRASVTDHITKKHKCRTFSITKYGDDMAFDLACDAREEMLEQLNQLGAGYTDRHGK